MGVVQSKRRTKSHNLDLSSSPTRPQHASLFTERSASYTGEPTNGKRSTHHSTLPRHAIRSISDDVVLVKRNNTLAVRNNKARRQLQPEGYVGVESTSRFLPEDWEAQDRDISLHFALKRLLDGNLSPIAVDHLRNRVCTVVDLGCANGAWLMDMATQFPDCSFVGIEFSAQSTLVPQMLTLPNVRTETTFGKLDQHLSLESSSVDLCHMRAQGLEFDQRDWMHLLSEAYRVLKPGGLLQIVDGHFAMKGTVLIESFFDTVRTLMQEQDREFDIALKYEQLLEQSGFQLLEKKCKTVQYAADESSSEDFTVVSLRALENAQELLSERMGLDDEEYQQRVEMVCAQCVQRGSGLDWYVYVARKPWTR